MKTILDLKPGETGVIREVVANGLSNKLYEMGCLPGEEVSMKHVAPLGDPISIQVAGYTLCLRKNEAACVILEEG